MTAIVPQQENSSGSVDHLASVSQQFQLSQLIPSDEGCENQLILWSDKKKTTPFAPALQEWMTRMKLTRDQAHKMIGLIRCSAQPNRAFRRERLVPSGVNAVSERMQFALSLEEFGNACFDTLPSMQAYINKLMEIEMDIDQRHDMFLRQVMVYSVKPLTDFVQNMYPAMSRAHSKLLKSRSRYDSARQKSDMEKTFGCRLDLAEKARIVFKHIVSTTHVQLTIAQAVDNYLRAEMEFSRSILKVTRDFKAPNHVAWWGAAKTGENQQDGSASGSGSG